MTLIMPDVFVRCFINPIDVLYIVYYFQSYLRLTTNHRKLFFISFIDMIDKIRLRWTLYLRLYQTVCSSNVNKRVDVHMQRTNPIIGIATDKLCVLLFSPCLCGAHSIMLMLLNLIADGVLLIALTRCRHGNISPCRSETICTGIWYICHKANKGIYRNATDFRRIQCNNLIIVLIYYLINAVI